MRRSVGLVAVVLVMFASGCSSGDAVTIEVFFGDQTAYGANPPSQASFRASGVAADGAVVCESGTMQQGHLESPEGTTVTSEEGAELYEAARSDEGTMDVFNVEEFVCDDGSGTFTMKAHSHVDFAKTENERDTPTWEIESGTGDYAGLSGSGERFVEFGASLEDTVYVYSGDVRSG